MTEAERNQILSEDYIDIIVDYRNNPELLEVYPEAIVHIMDPMFAVLHFPYDPARISRVGSYGYTAIPNVYGLTSQVSLQASRVPEILQIPTLNLRGQGTLIAIIDTGIDYTNPVFIRPDGTTKIRAIWDQTIQSVDGAPYHTGFGTEYRAEQINEALESENPLEIVPSIDENGHGTMMAAVAAGNLVPEENFSGVAPEAELVIIKLKPAKQNIKEFLAIPEDVLCFQENSIMWGIQYGFQLARELAKPIVFCLGLGSSQGSHEGRGPLAVMMNLFGNIPNTVFVTSMGNEGNLGRHYRGIIDTANQYDTMDLIVGEQDKFFSLEIWGDAPGIYSIDILSPSGEYIPRIAVSITLDRTISFIFERTLIYIHYHTVESETGDQLILLRFQNAAPGNWRFRVYGQGDLSTGFHAWLPMGDFISTETYFLRPDIYTTILNPGTAEVPITVTAYNPIGGKLYINASRGFTRNNQVKPDIAAPGVNYIAPNQNKEFVTYSGTGVAAAHTAGIVAMLLEWGIVRGNYTSFASIEIKNFLIRGARRSPNLTYPNRDWGYGILDIFRAFDVLRRDQ